MAGDVIEVVDAELERFRRQWQAEVSQRQGGTRRRAPSSTSITAPRPKQPMPQLDGHIGPGKTQAQREDYESPLYNFDDLEERENARRRGTGGIGVHPEAQKEPQSALEHFEKAIEKEGEGNMQQSVLHYRKAYRLDDQVDQVYRSKHLPPSRFPSKSANVNSSDASATVTSIVHHSPHGRQRPMPGLVESFSGAHVTPVPPPTEADPTPPCPMASAPHEIFTEILGYLAVSDVADYARLSLVCKCLAYLVRTEERIWRRICIESRFGFTCMTPEFLCTVKWMELPRTLDDEHNLATDIDALSLLPDDSRTGTTASRSMVPNLSTMYPTYLSNFKSRPRIRFSGVYISTVNYVRAGASSGNSLSWSLPVHLVTYYRYLRFYRDGTLISVLTSAEPHDVVPLLHKSNVSDVDRHASTRHLIVQQAQSASGVPPSGPPGVAAMREARRGRWRMSAMNSGTKPDNDEKGTADGPDPEGYIYAETEGPIPAYTYHLQLALRSMKGVGAAKNTKLVWRSFWSYNSSTDDWAKFELRNDKAYVWSRVKSWADA